MQMARKKKTKAKQKKSKTHVIRFQTTIHFDYDKTPQQDPMKDEVLFKRCMQELQTRMINDFSFKPFCDIEVHKR